MFPQQASREPEAKVGDLVQPVEDVSATEDSGRSRFDRFGRRFSREGASEAEKLGEQHIAAGKAVGNSYKSPPPGETYATVEALPKGASFSAPAVSTPGPMDFVGTLVLGAAVGFQAVGRINDRGRKKRER